MYFPLQWMTLTALICSMASQTAEARFVSATSPEIVASDYVAMRDDLSEGMIGFERKADMPGTGYRWDSPGARIRFRTNSSEITVKLIYTPKHLSTRNSIGVFRIDGRSDSSWTFRRPSGSPAKENVEVPVTIPAPNDGTFHTYEVILPYADSVDVAGVEISESAQLQIPESRPSTRYVAFGDSITHGFTASNIEHTYAFKVGEKKAWQLINSGFAGRGSQEADGDYVAGLNPDVVSILIGVNDWQGGADPQRLQSNMVGFLRRLHKGHPKLRVYLITPLWVPPLWQPQKAKYPLEEYRQALRDAAKAVGGDIQVVEGPTLIDSDPALFDKVAVHPNDAGFAQMADRLAQIMTLPPKN